MVGLPVLKNWEKLLARPFAAFSLILAMTNSRLDENFQLAVNYIQNLPPSGPYNPSNDEKLQFYSLYKQATLGPCNQKKPSFYDLIGKAKWLAMLIITIDIIFPY